MRLQNRIKAIDNSIRSYIYKHSNSCAIHNQVQDPDNSLLKRIQRITVFVHYNANGSISRSDWMYLESLSKISDILLVSNSPISSSDKLKISANKWCLLERLNTGYDFGAWKEAILTYKEIIMGYDEVILANNSCFFPAYPLESVFSTMELRDVDFWGITAFKENPEIGSSEARILKIDFIPTHVQSYFMVFNLRRVDDCFFDFWTEYIEQDTFVNTVRFGEIALTAYMNNYGKVYGVYIEDTLKDSEYYDSPDLSKNRPELLLSLGSPLIKKKCLKMITLKQYCIMMEYLAETNDELFYEIQSIDYSKQISKIYRVLNSIVRLSGYNPHSIIVK